MDEIFPLEVTVTVTQRGWKTSFPAGNCGWALDEDGKWLDKAADRIDERFDPEYPSALVRFKSDDGVDGCTGFEIVKEVSSDD